MTIFPVGSNKCYYVHLFPNSVWPRTYLNLPESDVAEHMCKLRCGHVVLDLYIIFNSSYGAFDAMKHLIQKVANSLFNWMADSVLLQLLSNFFCPSFKRSQSLH
jgi:hypothetical protein